MKTTGRIPLPEYQTEPKVYTLQITEKQVQALKKATDLLMRVQLGQWREITDHLPLKQPIDYAELHQHLDLIGRILSVYLIDSIDGYGSSLGVGHKKLPESNSILYDLHCILRRQLAVERAVESGQIENENVPRSQMPCGVDFDTPFHWGSEPLAKIERRSNEKTI